MGFLGRLFGKDFHGLAAKGDSLFSEGQFGMAKMCYEDALKAAGKDVPAGEIERVQESLDKACRRLARANFDEARRLVDLGQYQEASRLLEVCKDLCKNDEGILKEVNGLAHEVKAAIEDEHQKRMAAAGLGTHAQAGPGAGEEADGFGETDQDRFEVLIGSLPEAQAEEYRNLGERFSKAYLALNDGDLKLARKEMESLLLEKPKSPYLRYEVARLRGLLGDVQSACELYESLLDEDRDLDSEVELKAAIELADCKSKLGRHEEAEEDVLAAVAAHPDRVDVVIWLARVLRRAGEVDDAIRAAQKALNMDPQEVACHAEMALCLDRAQRTDDAAEHALAVVASGRGVMDLDEQELARVLELAGFSPGTPD